MNTDLARLAPYGIDGALRVVVEAPKGSSLKLEYDPADRVFTIARELPLGLVYPFDWGFVPGTVGEDGDPLDAMVLHQQPTYPGVILPCRILGMVEVIQRDSGGKPQVNNRIVTTPSWHLPLKHISEARDLAAGLKEQVERFFLNTAAFTGKEVQIEGWATRHKTEKFVKQNRR